MSKVKERIALSILVVCVAGSLIALGNHYDEKSRNDIKIIKEIISSDAQKERSDSTTLKKLKAHRNNFRRQRHRRPTLERKQTLERKRIKAFVEGASAEREFQEHIKEKIDEKPKG